MSNSLIHSGLLFAMVSVMSSDKGAIWIHKGALWIHTILLLYYYWMCWLLCLVDTRLCENDIRLSCPSVHWWSQLWHSTVLMNDTCLVGWSENWKSKNSRASCLAIWSKLIDSVIFLSCNKNWASTSAVKICDKSAFWQIRGLWYFSAYCMHT